MARRARRDRCRRRAGTIGVALLAILVHAAGADDEPPLDPLQQAVVDSLATTGRETAAELLEAAVRAADVEALDAAAAYADRLADAIADAGAGRGTLLADLGDATPPADLVRLERMLRERRPEITITTEAIRDATRRRLRDPGRLAAAAEALRSPDAAERRTAVERLARARHAALPAVVPLLDPEAQSDARIVDSARRLIAMLGPDARRPLLEWLGSEDVASWPAVIEALDASGAEDVEVFLLAPAVAADAPAAVRAAARRLLARRAAARGCPDLGLPSRDAIEQQLADRLDRVLGPEGLPAVDHLLLEPIIDPETAAGAFGGSVGGTVERVAWDPRERRLAEVRMSPRAARAREALHLARDLAALDARNPASVRLVLLARLEGLLVTTGARPPTAGRIRAALAGPAGFSPEDAADVLDSAVIHGLWDAAAAAAESLVPDDAFGRDGPRAPLPPRVRDSLVRALAVPDARLQFEAARCLALAAGDPPYAGSSRVLEILAHAATSTGVDRVVVAHPDAVAASELATGVSRFGFVPTVVATGREAIFTARSTADTTLVLLAARIATPSAFETAQLLQAQGLGGLPAILVVVDPLDDDCRGTFLTQLLLTLSELDRLAVVDRLESLFEPAVVAQTDRVRPPRFPDRLAEAAGPAAVDASIRRRAASARLERAREALALVALLGRRGWDVSSVADTAERALADDGLRAGGLAVLARVGRPEAQAALGREAGRQDLPDAARRLALEALESHVLRHGQLLDRGQIRNLRCRYNSSADEAGRAAAAAILGTLETAGGSLPRVPSDAASPRPIP